MISLVTSEIEYKENQMGAEANVLDLIVRELLDHVDRTWEYVINDDSGNPYLVVLPFAHFLRLRERSDDRGWWELKDVNCREIQFAMDLPENATIKDMIEFGQR